MSTVLTIEEAKKVTKGRTPLVPVEYERAVAALVECRTLEEAKYWDNAADALAAWAKIYKSEQVEREWRALKLHAYRRMGQLGGIKQPTVLKGIPGPNGFQGSNPGPAAYLRDHGLNRGQANWARRLALMDENEFNRISNLPRPPSPAKIQSLGNSNWTIFAQKGFYSFSSVISRSKAHETAKLVDKRDAESVRSIAKRMIDWLDEFEQHLPKEMHLSQENKRKIT